MQHVVEHERLKVWQQRGAIEPCRALGMCNHAVAVERGERNGREVRDFERSGELRERCNDALELRLIEIDGVHFVHSDDDVLQTKECRERAVTFGLRQ